MRKYDDIGINLTYFFIHLCVSLAALARRLDLPHPDIP